MSHAIELENFKGVSGDPGSSGDEASSVRPAGINSEHESDDRISILEESTRVKLWNDFVGNAPALNRVGVPRSFEGHR